MKLPFPLSRFSKRGWLFKDQYRGMSPLEIWGGVALMLAIALPLILLLRS